MLDIKDLPNLYTAYRNRWTERAERHVVIDTVIRGDLTDFDPNEEGLENRSPNLVQVALEDTAEAASLQPSVRVDPSSSSATAKKSAGKMEPVGTSYLDQSQWPTRTIESFMHLGGLGLFVWTIGWDPEQGGPVIEMRDPRTCYPEFGHRSGDPVRKCLFARSVYVTQLPSKEWQDKVLDACPNDVKRTSVSRLNETIVLVEYFDDDEVVVGAMISAARPAAPVNVPGVSQWVPVELMRTPTIGGVCPVVIGQRITSDGEPRGQFDQVVPVMKAHIRLMAMVLDYADQAVYSDVWVKDLIGEMPYGGGAYIQLGPTGSIGRVPPAVTSFTVHQELEQLIDYIHVGSRWPKTRPGEIDQAIASAKFVEATVGIMNTVIRTYHLIMARALAQALRIAYVIDKTKGAAPRTISGVRKNKQFLMEHDPGDIDLKAKIRVEYGLGLGRDPAQSAVLGIQMMGAGLISRETVQENTEGISDIAREQERIDLQQLSDMALARLLQGLEQGSIPPTALAEIAKARQTGSGIIELFDKYVAQPQMEQQATMMSSGLAGGGMVAPGAPGTPPGAAAPPPPDMAGLMGGLIGNAPPESINRLSVPLGGGSFAGTTVEG